MSYADSPYRSPSAWGDFAAMAAEDERIGFIRKTYLHLAGAIAAFIAIEAVLLNLPGIDQLVSTMMGGRISWLIVLGAFMGVSYLANHWANSSTSVGMQYLGLSLYVVGEAVIFVPILYVAKNFGAPEVIPMAAVITLVIFGGLTAFVFVTRADFSFLRMGLMVAGLGAMGVIACSLIFGFNLGLLFTGAMIIFASAYILYYTSNVLHHYRIGQHVAAALALFSAVALLFWYVLQMLMRSRD